MVNVAAQIALEGRRRAPVVYSPGRPTIPAPAPTRRTTPAQRAPGIDWVAVSQMKAAQDEAKAALPDPSSRRPALSGSCSGR